MKRRSKKKKISLLPDREMINFKKINTSTERLYQKVTNLANININNSLNNYDVNFYDVLSEPKNNRYLKFNKIKLKNEKLLSRFYYLGVGFVC